MTTELIFTTFQEKLKGAIRADALDEAIEKALGTTVDHNFGIDKTGNLYYGRRNSSQPTSNQQQQA